MFLDGDTQYCKVISSSHITYKYNIFSVKNPNAVSEIDKLILVLL